jgi:hypothetical protein
MPIPIKEQRASGHDPKLDEVLRCDAEVGFLFAQFPQSRCRHQMLGMLRLQKPQQDIGVNEGGHLAAVVAVDRFPLHCFIRQDGGVASMTCNPRTKFVHPFLGR